MVKHRLSFATVNMIDNCIIELIIDEGIEITMEMLDESDLFIKQYLPKIYGVIVNRVNAYHYTFEAKFAVASQDSLCAIAVISYNNETREDVDDLMRIRKMDDLNLKVFSGLELGWQDAYNWLQAELRVLEA